MTQFDAKRLGRIMAGYRLSRSPYYAPRIAPPGDLLMTAEEWAEDIIERYESEDSVRHITDDEAERWLAENDLIAVTHVHPAPLDCAECDAADAREGTA